jgi:transcriptional regulator with XRE-family HTH domain
MERIQMIDNVSVLQIRGKILGALIRDARLKAGKSTQEIASLLGVTPEQYERYELGGQVISLPELEILAFTLQTPVDRFLEREPANPEDAKSKIIPANLIKLRHRIIGAKMRQKRLDYRVSLDDLALQLGIERSELEAFELGLKPVPVPLLEKLCESLDCTMQEFLDQTATNNPSRAQQIASTDFDSLPPEIRVFIIKPVNRPYLDLAIKLSEMPVDRLRAIAEGLLEITF